MAQPEVRWEVRGLRAHPQARKWGVHCLPLR